MKTNRKEIKQAVLIFSLLAVLRFLPFLFGQSLLFGDNFSLQLPQKIWTAHWLRQGIIPLWNPLLFSGISWVGDISQTPLTPYILPFVFLPATLALNLIVVGSFLFTALGMYLFTKKISGQHWWSVTAGGLWALSSILVAAANNLPIIQSLSWFPWILLAGISLSWNVSAILAMTLAISGLMVAGYPQHLFIILPLTIIFSFIRKKGSILPLFFAWVVTGIISFLLTAPLTLPFAATLLESTRQLQSAEQAARGSMHPAELIKLVIPYFFDSPFFGIRWGPNWNLHPTSLPYFTWLAVIIFATAPWKRSLKNRTHLFLALGCVGGALLALGNRLPGYLFIMENIPGLSAIRNPDSWLVVTQIFGLCLLALIAPTWKTPSWLKKIFIPCLGLIVVGATIGLVLWWLKPADIWRFSDNLVGGKLSTSAFHTIERDRSISLLILGNILLTAIFTLFSWKAFEKRAWTMLTFFLLLEGLVSSQAFFIFAPNSITTSDLQAQPLTQALRDPMYRTLPRNLNSPYTDYGAYWEAVSVRQPFSDSFVDAQELASADHLVRLRKGLTPDWNVVANIPVVNGYSTLLPSDYQNIWEPNAGAARINLLSPIELENPLLRQWSVRYFIVDTWFAIAEDYSVYPEVATLDRWKVLELPALARIRFSDNTPATPSAFSENPNKLAFSVNNITNHDALIVADRFENGWRGKRNGRLVSVRNSNGMRSITLEQGENKIEMEYLPTSLRWSIVLFVIGTTLTMGLLFITHQLLRGEKKPSATTKSRAKK